MASAGIDAETKNFQINLNISKMAESIPFKTKTLMMTSNITGSVVISKIYSLNKADFVDDQCWLVLKGTRACAHS